MDRVFRVVGYAGLMTDEYPPFRLDMGGHDPAGPMIEQPPPVLPPRPAAQQHRWTPGRIASVIVGAVLALASVGLLTGGAAMLWADRVRDAEGYLSASNSFTANGYALTTEPVAVTQWNPALSNVVGDVRARVTAVDPGKSVFVGVAPTDAVNAYPAGVDDTTVRAVSANRVTTHRGTAPATLPQNAGIWAAAASGTGMQTLTWPVQSDDWTAVVMNAGGSPGIAVQAEVGATAPSLGWIAIARRGAGVARRWRGAHRGSYRASHELQSSSGPAQV